MDEPATSIKTPGLCQVCLDCLKHQKGMHKADSNPSMWLFQHHLSASSLISSSNAGCTICSLLWKSLLPAQQDIVKNAQIKDYLSYIVMFPAENLQSEGAYELMASIDQSFTSVGNFEVPQLTYFLLEPRSEAEKVYSSNPESSHTFSPLSWNLAVQWLEKCDNSHPDCSVLPAQTWYPTRLLNVGRDSDDLVRLEVTAEHNFDSDVVEQDQYVTLSHSWGPSHDSMLKLTRSNYVSLRSGIALSALPLTFQHAIEVTRKLEKRYIWIDSLCIFQDDGDLSDWLREAALMEKVYLHSFLNIAATGAADGSEGLFRKRDPKRVLHPTIISLSPLEADFVGDESEYVMTEVMFLNRELMLAPLNQRAWVLQERLLAPRVLHFGNEQLLWECRQGVLCERFPEQLPRFMWNFGPATFKSFTLAYGVDTKAQKDETDPKQPIYNLWKRIVRAYSETMLTFPSDKTIALSGIAKVIRAMVDDEYIVGMWRKYLESALLWKVNKGVQVNSEPSTRSFAYRAPTWSWLSVDGKIDPGHVSNQGLQIEVVSIDLKHRTDDTTGLVLDGQLHLKGRLRPLRLRKYDLSDLELQCWIMTVGNKDLWMPTGPVWERLGPLVHLDVGQDDYDRYAREKGLFVMPGGGPWPDTSNPFHDMILLKCVDTDAGVFHRIGIAVVNTEEKAEIWTLLKETDDNEADMPCVAYDAGTHRHTVILR